MNNNTLDKKCLTNLPKKQPIFDILCQVQEASEILPSFSVNNIDVRSNVAYLSITIPLEILDQVRNFFDSSIAISGYLKKQVQIRAAVEKVQSASYQDDLKKKALIFSKLVLSNFDLFTTQGASPRIAIKQTRDLLNSRGQDLTCSIVELIVRKAGRLSKRRKNRDNRGGD